MTDIAVTIQQIDSLTPDVRRYVTDRPKGFDFAPGQATEVAIDADGWRDKGRPFTFTSMPSDTQIEFTIKSYPDHDGVTEQIGKLTPGDRLLIGDPWGAITDKGPGTFIAGGAGVTPFMAILRDRRRNDTLDGCHLIFSNTREADIISREEFGAMQGLKTTFLVTDEPASPLHSRRLDKELLAELVQRMDQPLYVCGPPEMVDDVVESLRSLGADPNGITLEDN